MQARWIWWYVCYYILFYVFKHISRTGAINSIQMSHRAGTKGLKLCALISKAANNFSVFGHQFNFRSIFLIFGQLIVFLCLPESSCRSVWPPCLVQTGFWFCWLGGYKTKNLLRSALFSLKRRSVRNFILIIKLGSADLAAPKPKTCSDQHSFHWKDDLCKISFWSSNWEGSVLVFGFADLAAPKPVSLTFSYQHSCHKNLQWKDDLCRIFWLRLVFGSADLATPKSCLTLFLMRNMRNIRSISDIRS